LDFDLGEVAPYVTCDLSEVEMNVESDILPTLDLSEVPKNFDAFALNGWHSENFFAQSENWKKGAIEVD